ncbi:molecular chaperone DnaJ [Leifsonia xyli]|uniref:DnaJ family domain-containing protein n=1 Tax=Leifsonia xyli TaxID=1575 RepID=UPI0007CDD63B|nr:molecular chaperone DnaJ [Leifsonia xyli]
MARNRDENRRAPRQSDPLVEAARYRLRRDAEARGEQVEEANAGQPSMDQRAQIVETAIQQAIRRGDFDNLPGAGKPLPGLTGTHDPDWWIRRKIEREQLTGLGPPALMLRTEDTELDARLDRLASEAAVREHLEGFNRRIVEARRQLQGGPPVVTPTRDVDEEVARWRQRREERIRQADETRRAQQEAWAALSRRERRRLRRENGR